jgi:hypothetical protein
MAGSLNTASVQRLIQSGEAQLAIRKLDDWHHDFAPTQESLYL